MTESGYGGKSQNPTVLVTGATGFAGRALLSHLIRQSVQPRLLVRDIERARRWFGPTPDMVVGDLRKPSALAGVCDGISTVFHLASHASLRAANDADPDEGHWPITAIGTQALVESARNAGVRKFVFASSVKVFGETGFDGPDELTTPTPDSEYGRAKLYAEQCVLKEQKIHPTILRLAPMYGVGNDSIVGRLISALHRGWLPRLPNNGNCRSLVHVDDVVRALLLCSETAMAAGKVYHVTDGNSYSVDTLLRLIADALGRPPPSWTVPRFLLRVAASTGTVLGRIMGRQMPLNNEVLEKLFGNAWVRDSRIRTDLGFVTRNTLESALPEMVVHYRTRNGNGV